MTAVTWSRVAVPWRSLIARAFRWWLAELYGLLPDSIIAKFKNWTDRPLRLAFAAQEASLLVPARAGLPPTVISLDFDGKQPAILSKLRLEGAGVDIYLDESLLFRCVVDLPLAAENALEPILRNRLGLLVPLDPASLRFVWHVTERKIAANRIHVEVCLVKQATIDRAVAFSFLFGLVPRSAIVTGGGTKTTTIWRQADAPRVIAKESLYKRGLEGFAALCAIAAYALLVWHLGAREATLRDLVSDSRTGAAAATVIRDRAETAERTLMQARARVATPSALAVLEALTKTLPLDSSISEFHLQHGQVDIIGTASHATALLSEIEKAPAFENPSFEAPITAAVGGTGERFDLHFRVKGAGQP